MLSWVLTTYDTFYFAEERRLFYVALTRTQNNLFILAPEKDKSIFVTELEKDYKLPFETTMIQDSITDHPKCVKCTTGFLVERLGKDQNIFLGCSNYPNCDVTYKEIEILGNPVICNNCGGYMVTRSSNGKEFYGCTNFPFGYCTNTISKDTNTTQSEKVGSGR